MDGGGGVCDEQFEGLKWEWDLVLIYASQESAFLRLGEGHELGDLD